MTGCWGVGDWAGIQKHSEAKNGAQETTTQKQSEKLRDAAKDFCRENFPDIFDSQKYAKPDQNYMTEFSPHEMWRFDVSEVKKSRTGEEDLEESYYVLWNGKEFFAYDDADEDYNDLIVEQREIRMNSHWTFFASPLIISGLLAILMLIIIGYLLLVNKEVPKELWTILTEVAAFYFGKEGWSAMRLNRAED